MITEPEKKIILACARKYDVSEIYLFGSSIEKENYIEEEGLKIYEKSR